MTPEQKARQQIDRLLEQCGWIVQDYRQINISAGLGVAVREFPLVTGAADYLQSWNVTAQANDTSASQRGANRILKGVGGRSITKT